MWSNNSKHSADTGPSQTAFLSNTICISDTTGQWPVVQVGLVNEFSEYGEIARVDVSLFTVAKCILLTYFDVRAAQQVVVSSPDRCEPFPTALHDCRIVRVKLAAFAEKVRDVEGGFGNFGEVAHISASLGIAIVEFYDMRAAQMLIAASQGTAMPFSQELTPPPSALLGAFGCSWLGGAGNGLGGAGDSGKTPSCDSLTEVYKGAFDQAHAKPERLVNRPVRTQVSTKEFSKFDIDLDKIQSGEDVRTTVMVRGLSGQNARKDLLKFLERCALGDRFTFFYMPCKAHRNVPAGFAFVNFIAASDVHKLSVMVKSGFWREIMNDSQSKAPGVSYARFQGHDELSKHFSSSAVLREQDPEKRPIFRPEAVAKAFQERQKLPASLSSHMSSLGGTSANPMSSPAASCSPPGLEVFSKGSGGSGGVPNLAAFLSQARQPRAETVKDAPAYLQFPSSSPYGADQRQALQLLMAAKSALDSGYFNRGAMGA
eukprot:TRINITY_DN7819_c0_g1_i1.p1 TRINITY_DN7819_c0_g1~~TRINITY_DN7819_c0_g1_i1.p1  ORF type:complete len:486 (+),score=82.47 TRINITY_DN7819_c0_g1_i1:156-1613(+)